MFYEIVISISILIFAILTYYVICTLLVVQQSLRKLNFFMDDMEIRMQKVDPLIQAVSNVGEICEEKTQRLHQEFIEKKNSMEFRERPQSDLEEWMLLGLILLKKIFRRR